MIQPATLSDKRAAGEETATYCVGDTLWLMLVWQMVIMVMSIMLKIHRYVGVAVIDKSRLKVSTVYKLVLMEVTNYH